MLLWDGLESSAGVFVDVYMNGCSADKAASVFLTLYQVAAFANAEEFLLFQGLKRTTTANCLPTEAKWESIM